MRAYLPDYELKTPANLNEALRLLANEPGVWQPFAGGTDLMVLLEAGKLAHKHFVSLWGLPELRGIEIGDDAVTKKTQKLRKFERTRRALVGHDGVLDYNSLARSEFVSGLVGANANAETKQDKERTDIHRESPFHCRFIARLSPRDGTATKTPCSAGG